MRLDPFVVQFNPSHPIVLTSILILPQNYAYVSQVIFGFQGFWLMICMYIMYFQGLLMFQYSHPLWADNPSKSFEEYKIMNFLIIYIKESYPCNRPWRLIGFWDVEAATFSRQSGHKWRKGCQAYAAAALYLQEDSWYSFLLQAESIPKSKCDWKD
jgi:hypothetical protein